MGSPAAAMGCAMPDGRPGRWPAEWPAGSDLARGSLVGISHESSVAICELWNGWKVDVP